MFSALDAEPDPMLQKCAMSQQKQSQVTSFVYIVVVLTTSQVGVITNLDNREEPRSMLRDLRDQKPNKTYHRMSQPQVSHHQARFNEGLNKRYLPNYVNQYQSP